MFYKHQYFTLDPKTKRVFDENEKELRLTGNAYRVLVFLCEKKSANMTEIGDYLDPAGAKDYDENHLRQYRYKTNNIIGHDLVRYKNQVYFIDGNVTETDEIYDSENKKATTENNFQIDIPTKEIKKEIKKTIQKEFRKTEKKKPEEVKLLNKSEKKRFKIATLIALLLLAFLLVFFVYKAKNNKTTAIQKPQSEMVLIPAGDFIMGSTEEQAQEAFQKNDGGYELSGYHAEYPQRKIFLNDFYIDKKEVSNNDYKIFVEATNQQSPEIWKDQNLNTPNQPIVGIDWNSANAYCQWVEKRLPTEAEWEKAARGTDGRIWPWGNSWDFTKDNHGNEKTEYGYDENDGYKYTAPVGTELGISPYGVLNMAGNVYEWVSDDFNAYPGNDKYMQEDFNKGFKVLKGGAYTDGQSEQRPASRVGYSKDFIESDFGFRCAKDK